MPLCAARNAKPERKTPCWTSRELCPPDSVAAGQSIWISANSSRGSLPAEWWVLRPPLCRQWIRLVFRRGGGVIFSCWAPLQKHSDWPPRPASHLHGVYQRARLIFHSEISPESVNSETQGELEACLFRCNCSCSTTTDKINGIAIDCFFFIWDEVYSSEIIGLYVGVVWEVNEKVIELPQTLMFLLCKCLLTLSARGPSLDFRIWRLNTSDSDVYRRSPHWKNYKFVMAVDP